MYYSDRKEQLGNLLQLIQTANEGSGFQWFEEINVKRPPPDYFFSLILSRSLTSAEVSFTALLVLTKAEAWKEWQNSLVYSENMLSGANYSSY